MKPGSQSGTYALYVYQNFFEQIYWRVKKNSIIIEYFFLLDCSTHQKCPTHVHWAYFDSNHIRHTFPDLWNELETRGEFPLTTTVCSFIRTVRFRLGVQLSTSTIYLLLILLTSAATHSKVYTSVTQNTLLAHPVLENTRLGALRWVSTKRSGSWNVRVNKYEVSTPQLRSWCQIRRFTHILASIWLITLHF